jgi:hypothetical protein
MSERQGQTGGIQLQPFVIHAADTKVELWSGYRVQFGGMERHDWQTVLKAELKEALFRLAIPVGTPFTGYYTSTEPRIADLENTLFTNMRESMPSAVTSLRFERLTAAPPESPVPIDLIGGHLHYYRYEVGGQWATWEPFQILARWDRLPRRLAANGSARPAWFALREANASGLVELSGVALEPGANFGLRLTVHATKIGPRNAISYSEELVDGIIAAFHDDHYSEPLLAGLRPKFPGISDEELLRALNSPAGPLFTTPAITTKGGYVQISPADERCAVGALTIRQDSARQWPELSGELFTVRPIETLQTDKAGKIGRESSESRSR